MPTPDAELITPCKPLSEYDAETHPALARRCCLAFGATDNELAAFFEVNTNAIKHWRRAYPEFAAACKFGKDHADAEVVESLFARAKGYTHEAVKVFLVDHSYEERASDGTILAAVTTKKPLYVPYVEHYPPDTLACMFWLKNRQPGEWKDKVDLGLPEDPPVFVMRTGGRPNMRDITPPDVPAISTPTIDGDATGVDAAGLELEPTGD